MNTDPYDDDDDSPTLQRPPTASKVQLSPEARVIFVEESSTDTDLVPIDAVDEQLADAHTVDSLPPADAVALMDSPDYSDMETPKIPLDVAAVLLRASQDDEGNAR
jgi:hypothetical protein